MRKACILGAAILLAASIPSDSHAKSDCALMQQLAQQHSNDMARRGSLDHSGFSERAAKGARAENVAEGTRTKAETMAAWWASSGHAANMRLPGCKAVAFAVSKSGRRFWTMEIGQSPAELAAAAKGPGKGWGGRVRVMSFPRLVW
jgi:cysteine-rich secretory family protein